MSKRYTLYSILFFFVFASIYACKKEDPNFGCHGCGIDTSPKVLSFKVKGKLFQDCSFTPAANKRLQGIFMKTSDTTGIETITTGIDGSFDFTYSDTFVYGRPVTPQTTPPFGIRVIDDGVLFVVTPTYNFTNLKLVLKDSIHYNIIGQLAPTTLDLDNFDTLFYSPHKHNYNYAEYGVSTQIFKKAGPFINGTIDSLSTVPKVIMVDENGKPQIDFSMYIKRSNGSVTDFYNAEALTKEACRSQWDSVILKF
jgi:hypothetical protein